MPHNTWSMLGWTLLFLAGNSISWAQFDGETLGTNAVDHGNGRNRASTETTDNGHAKLAERGADKDGGDAGFIAVREVTLGDPSGVPVVPWKSAMTDVMYQKYCLANWDISRLRTYVDMLQAFGFNSIQLYDLWQRYHNAGWESGPVQENWPTSAGPRDWPEKMDAMADYARSKGLRTTLFI